ncbi:hypothetical protein K7432_010547 [Basidiobolus ranarum]|uniref:RanBD1 domain-containing protein n=1 Tax=Basidiobolus ranarum TaxID=34480 RepID=A0ABR2VVQ5_9FUNG
MSSVEQNPNKELEKEENVVSEELNSEIETQEKSVGVTSRKRERSEEVEEEASVPSKKSRETSTEIEEDTAQPKTVVEEEITLEDNSTKTVDKVTKEEESVLPNDESLVPQTTDSESLQKEVEKSNEDTKVDNPETNGDAPKSIFGSKFSGFSFGGTPAAGTSIFSSSEDKPASFESLLMSGSSALDADESKENGAASNEIGQGAIPKMDLQKVEVTTGEEGEDTLFQVRAKLFVMDAETKGWKERGIGSLKLNVKHNDKKSARLSEKYSLQFIMLLPHSLTFQMVDSYEN